MGLDVYFRRDIANVLRATACASEGSLGIAFELLDDTENLSETEKERLLRAYQQGARRALVSVGLGFGLEPVKQNGQPGTVATSPFGGLLWAETPQV